LRVGMTWACGSLCLMLSKEHVAYQRQTAAPDLLETVVVMRGDFLRLSFSSQRE
jgi:hypothetical protein